MGLILGYSLLSIGLFLFEALEKLAPGDNARWHIQAESTIDEQKSVQFRVDLRSDFLDGPVTAEEPTVLLPYEETRTTAKPVSPQ